MTSPGTLDPNESFSEGYYINASFFIDDEDILSYETCRMY